MKIFLSLIRKLLKKLEDCDGRFIQFDIPFYRYLCPSKKDFLLADGEYSCMLYHFWWSTSFWRVRGTGQILPRISCESCWLSGEQFCTSFFQALTAISFRYLYTCTITSTRNWLHGKYVHGYRQHTVQSNSVLISTQSRRRRNNTTKRFCNCLQVNHPPFFSHSRLTKLFFILLVTY